MLWRHHQRVRPPCGATHATASVPEEIFYNLLSGRASNSHIRPTQRNRYSSQAVAPRLQHSLSASCAAENCDTQLLHVWFPLSTFQPPCWHIQQLLHKLTTDQPGASLVVGHALGLRRSPCCCVTVQLEWKTYFPSLLLLLRLVSYRVLMRGLSTGVAACLATWPTTVPLGGTWPQSVTVQETTRALAGEQHGNQP